MAFLIHWKLNFIQSYYVRIWSIFADIENLDVQMDRTELE